MPVASRAGSVIKPPPPAIASMKPPAKPARNSSPSVQGGIPVISTVAFPPA